MKACVRIRYFGNATSQYHPPGDNDEDEQNKLQDREEVHSVNAELRDKRVDDSDGDDNPNRNASLRPLRDRSVCCYQNI